ncbi:MAG TPA: efflux RND transporter periplasmic adaptor subunit [Flavobacteriaceae bacterium]|nr:efflux RND transporter periplasmic adaptor subunit [Flavobacteriaceae bacterium]
MKKIQLILLASLVLSSCGNTEENTVETVIESGQLSQIRAKKSELHQKQQALKQKMALLDAAIEKLDTIDQRTLITVQVLNDTIFKHYIEVQGNVETDENIIIYPEFSGVLEKIYVEEGQQVSKGQILAKIDDGGLSSQLAQLKTKAALAKTTFERRKNLWEQKIGSEIQFLQAKSNYEAMQSSVEQLQSQLAKTVVRAPFSGVIDQVISDEGQVVSPGANQLFRLINLNEMYVTADVPENYLGSIEKGTEVLVDMGSIGKEFEGKIKEVSSYINPNNRSFQVKVSVPNNKGLVKPNLIATIKLNNYTAKNAIVVPQSTVREDAKGNKIAFVVDQKSDSLGVAQKIVVETGKNYQGKVEIKKGLKAGQILVLKGSRSIRDGEKVKVKSDQ